MSFLTALPLSQSISPGLCMLAALALFLAEWKHKPHKGVRGPRRRDFDA